MKSVAFHPEAQAEFIAAARYYEAQAEYIAGPVIGVLAPEQRAA